MKLFSSLLIFLLILNSCHQKTEQKSVENFEVFYSKFHNDSLFQMSRIKFPLEGMQIDGTTKEHWSEKNWTLLKTRIYDVDTTEFKVKYQKTNTEFIEKIWIENSGFSSEYKFKVIENQWFLVFANDVNL